MAGAMRKMAVYLGLVEDDGYDGRGFDPDDEFEPELDPEPERDRRRHEPSRELHREEPERKVQTPAPRAPLSSSVPVAAGGSSALSAEIGRPARIAPVASITPERQSLEKNAPVIMPKVVSEREPYRITTLHPRTYNEARTIGEHFREGTPVIMNLTEMDDTDAKRLVDFAAGLVFGLHGSIERVTQKVFLLSPANVDVTAEDKARIAEGGFFNQS
ncbi:cell division protein SepF [Streptomyces sp. TRM66268-LWL]|uniref:Cell division protein SepF n=1 Tax=Streptomyces polyasparticus TaxID=2767826 RepID=A0ABR7S9P1_9ACTN|nr:cell division protein SepF [Streptomyces polyasparticus]MBC9712201.1 cell division protein SepF [Streptomyces polyasparticus]